MRKEKVTTTLFIYEHLEELSLIDKELMEAAVKARNNAYAPYSNFQVGAAVRLANGTIVIGNNQENACYPSGLCAERVAIFQAGALYPNVLIESIAISATSKNYVVKEAAAPCGNCRQAMSEYEQKQDSAIPILFMGEEGEIIKSSSIAALLPLAFGNSFLK